MNKDEVQEFRKHTSLFKMGYGINGGGDHFEECFARDIQLLCEAYNVQMATHPFSEYNGDLPTLFIIRDSYDKCHIKITDCGKLIPHKRVDAIIARENNEEGNPS